LEIDKKKLYNGPTMEFFRGSLIDLTDTTPPMTINIKTPMGKKYLGM
jgi:hypothetical protein